MKFRENDKYYYSYQPGSQEVICFNRQGEIIETIAFEKMRDMLMNYCVVLNKFPWEE